MTEVYSFDDGQGETMMLEMAATADRMADRCKDRIVTLAEMEAQFRQEAEILRAKAQEMLEQNEQSATVPS